METKYILLLVVLLAGALCMNAAGQMPELSATQDLSRLITSPGQVVVSEPTSVSSIEQETDIGSIPAIFIKNEGQFRDEVFYTVISDAGPIYFMEDGSILRFDGPEADTSTVVGFTYPGASEDTIIDGVDPLTCKVNFLLGSDPSEWAFDVETYRAIKYAEIYSGIDLVYEGSEIGIKSTYHVRPGANPEDIAIKYYGHDEISVAADGTLVISTPAGIMTHSAPYCYQVVDGNIVEVSSSYVLLGQDQVGFAIGEYDPDLDLIIDPVLMKYGLYFRGFGMESANGVAVDSNKNAYVIGTTFSAPYDVPAGSTGSNAGGTDVIVVKINPDGTLPRYITYLGGKGDDAGYGIRVDSAGNAYLTGTTNSTNFPVVNPLQPQLAGKNDAFITKLSPNGTPLIFSTYVGGTKDDYGYAIALDSANNVYTTGYTESPQFPIFTTSAQHRTARNGLADAYAIKVRSDGQELLYSEYIGGRVSETGYGIAVDTKGDAYITGETYSYKEFPTINAYDSTFNGYSDIFITKVAPSGDPFIYSTLIGGSGRDGARAIAVDGDGYAYITGSTWSKDFPVKDAFKPIYPGVGAAFYTRINPSGDSLSYSTYLNGPEKFDEGRGIAVTPAGSVYITGITHIANLQLYDPFQPKYGGGVDDAFVAKFINGQAEPAYLTYLGGSDKDEGYAIATDGLCEAYIVGLTRSLDFPTSSPYPENFTPKGSGGFIAVLKDCVCTPPVANFTPPTGCVNTNVTFTDLSTGVIDSWLWEFGDGTNSTDQNTKHAYTTANTYTVTLTVTNECGNSSVSHQVVIGSSPVANFTPPSGCTGSNVTFTDSSTGSPTSWTWEFDDGTPNSTAQNVTHTYDAAGTYHVKLTVTNDCGTDSVSGDVVIGPKPVANFTPPSGCMGSNVTFTDSSTGSPTAWTWEFDDGTPNSTAQNVTHTYDAAGTYHVKLTITNDCGMDSVSGDVVIGPKPVANFTPENGCVESNVTFTDLSTGSPTSWLWDFGDGTNSTAQNTEHAYTMADTYTVILTVENGCGNSSVSNEIVIGSPPVAIFTPQNGCVNVPVQFNDNSTNANNWTWDLGDGTIVSAQNVTHTYLAAGPYTVKLTVENDSDCGNDSISHEIVIGSPPVANFTPQNGCVNVPLQFTDLSTGNPDQWLWDFGDGTPNSTSQNTEHAYTTAGTFTVILTVTNTTNENECRINSVSHTVVIGVAPVANFYQNNPQICNETTVLFIDQSTGYPDEWLWDFGDGNTSTEQNPPQHTYYNTNNTQPYISYLVTLTVTNSTNENECRTDTVTQYVNVTPCVCPYNCPPLF